MTYKVRHSAAASCLANCATRDKGASAVSKTSSGGGCFFFFLHLRPFCVTPPADSTTASLFLSLSLNLSLIILLHFSYSLSYFVNLCLYLSICLLPSISTSLSLSLSTLSLTLLSDGRPDSSAAAQQRMRNAVSVASPDRPRFYQEPLRGSASKPYTCLSLRFKDNRKCTMPVIEKRWLRCDGDD